MLTIVNKTLVWPHDVERFQSSTFCLLWCSSRYGTAVEHSSLLNRSGICDGFICCNIFCSYSRFEYKTAFNLVKIHLLFRIMLLIQWSVFFLSSMLPFLVDWNIYPVCFPNICWHSWMTNQWKFVQQTVKVNP